MPRRTLRCRPRPARNVTPIDNKGSHAANARSPWHPKNKPWHQPARHRPHDHGDNLASPCRSAPSPTHRYREHTGRKQSKPTPFAVQMKHDWYGTHRANTANANALPQRHHRAGATLPVAFENGADVGGTRDGPRRRCQDRTHSSSEKSPSQLRACIQTFLKVTYRLLPCVGCTTDYSINMARHFQIFETSACIKRTSAIRVATSYRHTYASHRAATAQKPCARRPPSVTESPDSSGRPGGRHPHCSDSKAMLGNGYSAGPQ